MAGYTIFLQSTAWTDQVDAMMRDVERVDDLMNQLADDVVLPILGRHYDASGIKQGGLRSGLLKQAITKRGAMGNIVTHSDRRLTVGVDYGKIPYAKWVIEGRGPVRPIRAKSLMWVDPDTGKAIFSKYSRPAPPHPIYFLGQGELREIERALAKMIESKVK